LAGRLETVREEERTHIARELHDGLGQSLTALKFDLAWLAGKLSKTNSALSQKAHSITAQIDDTIKTVRRISTELRPGMLDDFGLAAAIEWYAQEFQERTGIHCDCSAVLREPPLSRSQATALFRICHETMTNVARHAKATRVRISLIVQDHAVRLQVQDNGRGMLVGMPTGTHSLGIVGMRERAALLDGALVISETPGGGVTVTVSIPLETAASHQAVLLNTQEES
jgi:signal transduction histidine kinase